MEPTGTFGPRLRQERERRQISLASIAENTKISRSLLEALERDDVKRWPSGIFRRAFLRSYAVAIGMDPDEVWREFSDRFPETAATVEPESKPMARVVRSTGDSVELVFRVSVPRSWMERAIRVASYVPARPRLWRRST